MNQPPYYSFLISLFLAFCLPTMVALAQPTINLKKAILDKDSQRITLPYEISMPVFTRKADRKKIYEVKFTPFYTEDNGATFNEMKLATGDLTYYHIKEESKKIYWDYYDENPNFKGSAQFKLKYDYKPSVLGLRNQWASLFSLALPGLGNTQVRYYDKFRWRWHLVYLGVFACLGLGAYFEQQSETFYNQYLDATDVATTQSARTSAATNRLLATSAFVIGGSLWITDIVKVFLRGAKNRREKARIYQEHPEVEKYMLERKKAAK